jgi:hypothetical protein
MPPETIAFSGDADFLSAPIDPIQSPRNPSNRAFDNSVAPQNPITPHSTVADKIRQDRKGRCASGIGTPYPARGFCHPRGEGCDQNPAAGKAACRKQAILKCLQYEFLRYYNPRKNT